MSFWLAIAFIALGVLLRMAFERPRRFADVDFLVRKARAEREARELAGRDV